MYIPLITDLFAIIMKFIMQMVTSNFGLAIILFTIITKLLLAPLQLKSKKGMIDQQRIAPEMAKLEKKYGNNKQKYSEEVQKLYKKEGVSMFGGCLPTILLLVVILGLYGVIYKPVHYLMVSRSEKTVNQIATQLSYDYEDGTYIKTDEDSDKWMERLNAQLEKNQVNELNLAQAMTGNVDNLKKEVVPAADEGVDINELFEIDFAFLGLDLGEQPSYNPINISAILPVLSAITAFLVSWLSQKINAPAVSNSASASAANSSKMMLYMMPLMSLFIGFTLPAGLTIYWIVNNILTAVQDPILMIIAKKRYGTGLPAADEKKKKAPVETTGEDVTVEDDDDASDNDSADNGENKKEEK